MNDFREYSDYLMHYGRKGQRWGRSIFQDDYDPIGHLAKWGEDAYNAGRQAASNAYNTARQAGSTAYNYARQVGDRAADAGRNAYNYARQRVADAGDYINRNVTGDTWGHQAGVSQQQANYYRQMAKKSLEGMRTRRNYLAGGVYENSTKDPADDYTYFSNQYRNAQRSANFYKNMYDNTVRGKAENAINDLRDRAENAATNAYNAVRDTAYNTRYQLGQLRDDAYNAGRQAATNAYNAGRQAATNAYNAGRQAASEAYNSAKETASNVGNSIQNRFNKIRRDVNWAKVDFEQYIRKHFKGDLSTPTRQGLHNLPSGWKSLGNNIYEYWLTDTNKRTKRR